MRTQQVRSLGSIEYGRPTWSPSGKYLAYWGHKADFLQSKLAWSMFCQGWLRYLPEDAAQQLLERTGLTNEYVPIQPEGSQDRRCSGCGTPPCSKGNRHSARGS